jgi:hypothetical protein
VNVNNSNSEHEYQIERKMELGVLEDEIGKAIALNLQASSFIFTVVVHEEKP